MDVWPQLSRIKMVYDALRHGTSPFHSFMFYCGYPSLRFYSPLFHFLGGFIALFTSNMLLSARLLLFILHLLSAWAMYRYLRLKTGHVYASALGTLVYLVVPWRVLYLAISGAYPPALLYLLLPLIFLSFEQFRTSGDFMHALMTGLWLSFAAISHVVYSLFIGLFLLVFLLFSLKTTDTKAPTRRLLAGAGLAILAAVVFSAWFVLPFLLEYRSHYYPEPTINIPPPDLRVLLGLKARVGGYVGAYLGATNIILVILAIVGIIRTSRHGAWRYLPALAGFVLTLLLLFAPRLLGQSQVLYTAGLSSERFLLFFSFFAALLVPSAYLYVERFFTSRKRSPQPAFYVICGLVLLDCLPSLVRVSYDPADELLAVRQDIYQGLSAENATRVLDINVPRTKIDDVRRTCRYPSLAYIYGNLASPLGPHYNQFAPRSMRYVYPLVNLVANDLGETSVDTLATRSIRALALMGVSYIITLPGLVDADSADETPKLMLKRGLRWDDHFVRAQAEPPLAVGQTGANLVLASNTVLPMPGESLVAAGVFFIADDWEKLLDTLDVDLAYNRLNFIPVTSAQPVAQLPDLPAVQITQAKVTNPRTEIDLSTTSDCFLRMAVSYYPELAVSLDGAGVPFHETKDHFIYIRCPAGSHHVNITAPTSPLRTAMLGLSGLGFVLFGAVMVRSRRRRRVRPD